MPCTLPLIQVLWTESFIVLVLTPVHQVNEETNTNSMEVNDELTYLAGAHAIHSFYTKGVISSAINSIIPPKASQLTFRQGDSQPLCDRGSVPRSCLPTALPPQRHPLSTTLLPKSYIYIYVIYTGRDLSLTPRALKCENKKMWNTWWCDLCVIHTKRWCR